MSEKFITSTLNKKNPAQDNSLRPVRFGDFPGQDKEKEKLQLFVAAAKQRGEALGHLLLSGPPGLGKTTLAYIIANEMGSNIKSSSGPAIEKPGDLAGLLTSLQDGDILFIDEIHRLNNTVEEYLYSAMEDYFIDIMLDQGPGARSVRLNVAHFTLIGATTRQGMLTAPLRSRFGMACRLELYNPADLKTIINRSAGILEVHVDDAGAYEIARRCRGTPRIANSLLRWARDYAQIKGAGDITKDIANAALRMYDIDEDGLDSMDNRLLQVIIDFYRGGPVGLKTLSVAVGEEERTIEDVYEPFLIQEGFLMRTSQGRIATPRAWQKLGLKPPANIRHRHFDQPELFE